VWPSIGLCWGTVRQASLLDLIAVAALHGFPTITVPPSVFERSLASGETVASLRQRLAEAGIRVTVIDALTRDLPGACFIDEIPAIWRDNWKYGLEDLIRIAEALEAPTINVTHYLGKPVAPHDMAQAIAGLGARAGRHGLQLSVEFMPETGLPSLPATARIVQLSGAANVGIMLDTWHLLRSGGGAEDIRALPVGSLTGVQLNDRRADATQSPRQAVSERSLPGEGAAPLKEIVQAILDNTPSVSFEIEVLSSELVALSPLEAGRRVAHAVAAWQRMLGLEVWSGTAHGV
jgi:sugar phosphate isomerase/epimerase